MKKRVLILLIFPMLLFGQNHGQKKFMELVDFQNKKPIEFEIRACIGAIKSVYSSEKKEILLAAYCFKKYFPLIKDQLYKQTKLDTLSICYPYINYETLPEFVRKIPGLESTEKQLIMYLERFIVASSMQKLLKYLIHKNNSSLAEEIKVINSFSKKSKKSSKKMRNYKKNMAKINQYINS